MARGPIPDKPSGRPTVPDVLAEARAYLAKPGNELGGNLHTVLDDGNVEDHHLESCRLRAEEAGDSQGAWLAGALLHMTGTQRRKIYASL